MRWRKLSSTLVRLRPHWLKFTSIIYHVSSCKYNGLIIKPWLCHCERCDPGQVTLQVPHWRKEQGIGKQESHLRPAIGRESCNYSVGRRECGGGEWEVNISWEATVIICDLVLKMWFRDPQHGHHVKACLKCRILSFTSNLLMGLANRLEGKK